MSKHLRHIVIHLCLSSVLLLYILYSQYGIDIPWNELWAILSSVILASISFSLLSLPLSKWLDKKILWNVLPAWRFASGFSLNYLLASVLITMIFAIYFMVMGMGIADSASLYQEVWIKLFLLLFIMLFVLQLIELAIQAFRHYHHQQLQEINIEQEHIHTQFEILRTQLNPHFLFNCLNTISALIYRSPQEAEAFIRSFAQLNQRILATQKEGLVGVNEEIELAKLYLSLMQVRYGDALIVNVDLPNRPSNHYLPPLSLQILLENAIKHNTISTKDPLTIDITYADTEYLLVKNNLLPLKQAPTSFAMGLDLLKKRYAFFTNKKINITHNEEKFAVVLPLIAH